MEKGYRVRWASEIDGPNPGDELMHFGIKGQKWGVRRFQNEDGTLTEEGRRRYMASWDTDHGRKMSLVGRLKFGKEVTRKTEADDELRAQQSIAAQNGDKTNMDYRNGQAVSDYVHSVHTKFRDAANKDSVWKKNHIGQDTAWDYINSNKKYKAMIDHILSKTSESNKAAVQANNDFYSSKETANKPGAKYVAKNRANVKYWDDMNDAAMKYINKHFSGEEADIAKALVYWRFIDW